MGYTQEFFDQLEAIMHRGGGIRITNEEGKLIDTFILANFPSDTYAALEAQGYMNPIKVLSLLQSTINGKVYVTTEFGEQECVFDVIGNMGEIERLQEEYKNSNEGTE